MLKIALELGLDSPSLSYLPPCCTAPYVCLFSPMWLVRLFPDEVLLGVKGQSLSHLCRARSGEHFVAIYRPHEHGGHKTQVVFLPALYSWGELLWDLLGEEAAVLPLSYSFIFRFPPPIHRTTEGGTTSASLQRKKEHFVNEQTHPAPSAWCLTREKSAKLLHVRVLKEKKMILD